MLLNNFLYFQVIHAEKLTDCQLFTSFQ